MGCGTFPITPPYIGTLPLHHAPEHTSSTAPPKPNLATTKLKDEILAFAAEWEVRNAPSPLPTQAVPSSPVASLTPPQRALGQGVADFLSARHAVTFNGPDDDDSVDVDDTEALETIHDLMGQVRLTTRVRLCTEDMTNLSVILAWWVFQQHWKDPEIHFTYRGLAEAKGVAYKGDFAKRARRSLVRLAAWGAEMTEKDPNGGGERWETIGFLHYVRGHDNAEDREQGAIVASLHRALHDRMLDRRFSLFPLQVYMQLRTDLAKELYRFLETQRGFGPDGDYSITISPEVLRTIGCRQVDQRQTRFRLRKACQEIMAADPRYIAMTIDKSARYRKSRPAAEGEATYVLTVKRRRALRGSAVVPTLPASGGAGTALSAAS